MREHERVMRGERFELVLGADERKLRHLGDLGGEGFGEEGTRIEPGPDRRAALRQGVEAVQRKFNTFDTVIDLRRIAAEFLP